jgi:hypothetical protein
MDCYETFLPLHKQNFEQYLKEKKENNLISFWSEMPPSPLRTAMIFTLAWPASSVTSERAFSIAGLILTKQRSKLAPETVSNILFLHQNNKK